jgi:hypothetical protein
MAQLVKQVHLIMAHQVNLLVMAQLDKQGPLIMAHQVNPLVTARLDKQGPPIMAHQVKQALLMVQNLLDLIQPANQDMVQLVKRIKQDMAAGHLDMELLANPAMALLLKQAHRVMALALQARQDNQDLGHLLKQVLQALALDHREWDLPGMELLGKLEHQVMAPSPDHNQDITKLAMGNQDNQALVNLDNRVMVPLQNLDNKDSAIRPKQEQLDNLLRPGPRPQTVDITRPQRQAKVECPQTTKVRKIVSKKARTLNNTTPLLKLVHNQATRQLLINIRQQELDKPQPATALAADMTQIQERNMVRLQAQTWENLLLISDQVLNQAAVEALLEANHQVTLKTQTRWALTI